jgi:hypothetical protein
MKEKFPPSPFYRDIKWGEWAFFTLGTCGVAFIGAYFGGEGNIKAAVAAAVAVFLPVGKAFLTNPKALPWVEITPPLPQVPAEERIDG